MGIWRILVPIMLDSRQKNTPQILIHLFHWDHTKDCLLSPVEVHIIEVNITAPQKYIMIVFPKTVVFPQTGLRLQITLLLMISKYLSNIYFDRVKLHSSNFFCPKIFALTLMMGPWAPWTLRRFTRIQFHGENFHLVSIGNQWSLTLSFQVIIYTVSPSFSLYNSLLVGYMI